MLSSVHKSVKMDEDKLKPETILYYIENKCGTNVFDQLCSNYSCARRTLRWSMRLFFGILDQARVNSCILWNLIADHEVLCRHEFLKSLVLALVKTRISMFYRIIKWKRETAHRFLFSILQFKKGQKNFSLLLQVSQACVRRTQLWFMRWLCIVIWPQYCHHFWFLYSFHFWVNFEHWCDSDK